MLPTVRPVKVNDLVLVSVLAINIDDARTMKLVGILNEPLELDKSALACDIFIEVCDMLYASEGL